MHKPECSTPARNGGLELSKKVYAQESTTIDLCLSVFPWAHFCQTKVEVKMHTLLDLRSSIPSVIHASYGKLHNVHAPDLLTPEAGAIYVMFRGHVDFARLHRLHLVGALFVTRAKSNLKTHRIYSTQTDCSTGILCDQTIVLDGSRCRRNPSSTDLDVSSGHVNPGISATTEAPTAS